MKIDLFVGAVRDLREQERKKGQQHYISRICGGETPIDGELKLGAFVELVDIINHINFCLFLMNSFRASGVQ
jgi:hypothetical protein